jgi:predicted XRE-type DNA-binding protein
MSHTSERGNTERSPGARAYDEYWEKQLADPGFRATFEEEATKKELWLQLVEARQAAGLTQQQVAERLGVSQAQVARIEKRGYDAYTLNTLRHYVQALGEGFALHVSVRSPASATGPYGRDLPSAAHGERQTGAPRGGEP